MSNGAPTTAASTAYDRIPNSVCCSDTSGRYPQSPCRTIGLCIPIGERIPTSLDRQSISPNNGFSACSQRPTSRWRSLGSRVPIGWTIDAENPCGHRQCGHGSLPPATALSSGLPIPSFSWPTHVGLWPISSRISQTLSGRKPSPRRSNRKMRQPQIDADLAFT